MTPKSIVFVPLECNIDEVCEHMSKVWSNEEAVANNTCFEILKARDVA